MRLRLSTEILDQNVGGDMSNSEWFPELQAHIYIAIESSSPLPGPEEKKVQRTELFKGKRKAEEGKGFHAGQRVTEEERRQRKIKQEK